MRLLRHLRSALLLCAAVPIMLRAQPPAPMPPGTADTTAWNRWFAEREAAAPTDARLWIDRFNHLFNRSRQSLLVLRGTDDTERLPGESDQVLLLKDSTGRQAGTFSQRIVYDEALLRRAFDAIDRGIALHPDRLDMRLGRAAACRYAERWLPMTETLLALIDRAEQNGGGWLSPEGEPKRVAPAELVADYLQDYVNELFDRAVPEPRNEAAEALERLLLRETTYCPASAVACNNRAAWLYGSGEPDAALEWFIRASEADPDDPMIRFNIGCLYAARGDRANARRWWTALLDTQDAGFREAAAEALERLEEEE
ncbi:MAG: hypothetical protein K2N93_05690 [Alistipes sp.]|nr:hypothetical protein [Alistipes sp.]